MLATTAEEPEVELTSAEKMAENLQGVYNGSHVALSVGTLAASAVAIGTGYAAVGAFDGVTCTLADVKAALKSKSKLQRKLPRK